MIGALGPDILNRNRGWSQPQSRLVSTAIAAGLNRNLDHGAGLAVA
jgi:hypothetical protein